MRNLKYLFLIVTCLLFASCSKEEPDKTPGNNNDKPTVDVPVDIPKETVQEQTEFYNITYRYHDDVIVYDENNEEYVDRIEQDSIIFLSGNTPQGLIPQAGDIIASGMSDVFPFGLGNKVVSVTKSGNTYQCLTTSASLDEIFAELEIDAEMPLALEGIDGLTDADGNFYETTIAPFEHEAVASSRASVGSPDALTINLPSIEELGTSNQLTFGTVLDFEYSQGKGMTNLSFEFFSGLKTEVELLKATVGAKVKWPEIPLQLPPFAIGPVVFRPYLGIQLGMFVNSEAKLGLAFSNTMSYKVGAKNESGNNWEAYHQFTRRQEDKDAFGRVEVSGNFNVGPTLGVGAFLGLYTRGVAMSIESETSLTAYVEAKGSPGENVLERDSEIGTSIDVGFDVALQAELFGKDIWAYEKGLADFNVWKWSYPLYPQVMENSLSVDLTDKDNFIYTAKYRMQENGFLCWIYDHLFAGICLVGPDGSTNYIWEENSLSKESPDKHDDAYHEFQLNGLERGTTYKAYPCILINDTPYTVEGIEFTTLEEEETPGDDNNEDNNDENGGTGGGNGNDSGSGDDNNNGNSGEQPYTPSEDKASARIMNIEFINMERPTSSSWKVWLNVTVEITNVEHCKKLIIDSGIADITSLSEKAHFTFENLTSTYVAKISRYLHNWEPVFDPECIECNIHTWPVSFAPNLYDMNNNCINENELTNGKNTFYKEFVYDNGNFYMKDCVYNEPIRGSFPLDLY